MNESEESPLPVWWDRFTVNADGCWIWNGPLTVAGYGLFPQRVTLYEKNRKGLGRQPRRGEQLAHRIVFMELRDEHILCSMTLDHFRMNPGPRNAPCSRACVNPDHLEIVTRGENVLRGTGFAARNARQTTCKNGHPFDEIIQGHRSCRICRLENYRRYWQRQKTARQLHSVTP